MVQSEIRTEKEEEVRAILTLNSIYSRNSLTPPIHRFSKEFTPMRPTLYSVTEYFFERNPEKIGFMRVDSLSQVLNLANVHAEGRYLVVDDTQGLVLSAVAERMGGYGKILGIYDGLNQNYDVLRYYNFSKRILDSISALPWTMVDKDQPTSGTYSQSSMRVIRCTKQFSQTFSSTRLKRKYRPCPSESRSAMSEERRQWTEYSLPEIYFMKVVLMGMCEMMPTTPLRRHTNIAFW